MSSILTSHTTNHVFNDYISKCDLINKYNITSIYDIPQLSKIVLEFSSDDVINSLDIAGKKEWDSDLQVKSFLLLYLLSLNYPFINFNKIKSTREDSKFSIKIILSSKKEIFLFLVSLFHENWNLLVLDDFSFFKFSVNRYIKYMKKNKSFVLNSKIPASSFFELDNFLNKNLLGISSKNLNIKASFLFLNNIGKDKLSLNTIKNIPLFWITNLK